MAGLVPAIRHMKPRLEWPDDGWMPGSNPGMTMREIVEPEQISP
jgi:hypothetical protein